ncbi:MAG: type IV secretory system conjugative DNA transfer family protein, partial [Pseudomonadota bacterium]
TAATVTLARKNGVVTLPELADKIAGLGSASDEWLSFEYDISTQPEPEIREVAQELREFRASSGDGAGFKGIKGEISRSFTCLMDPQVRDALSPPYDFCFSWLTQDDHPATLVNIMEDLEFALTSGPVIRALFTCALIYKRRNLSARPQFWCLDEIGNCGAWPLAETMATANAGYGIRTAYVVQSTRQLENLKPGAGEVIPNSCGTAIYLGTRSLPQASQVSKQLGRITLEYDDFAQQERARAAHAKAVREIVLSGADPIQTALEAQHHKRLATNRTKMPRDLRSPDEVMNEANDRAFVFMPGVLERPFYAHVPKYWRRRDLAGRYLADPFHGPANTVEVGRWFGQSRRPVITTRVPEALADWPQYRDAETWSYVQGYRPSLSGL